VDPTALDYGEVAVDAENSQLITLSNVGTLPLNISGIVLNDEVNYTLDLSAGPNPCGSASFILDFGGACTLAVVFNPQGEGDFSATLTLNSDDPNNPSLIVNLLGTGIPSSGGCSLEQVPSMISHHVWLWVLPLLGMYLWRRKAQ
jgi:hypothetical protein